MSVVIRFFVIQGKISPQPTHSGYGLCRQVSNEGGNMHLATKYLFWKVQKRKYRRMNENGLIFVFSRNTIFFAGSNITINFVSTKFVRTNHDGYYIL